MLDRRNADLALDQRGGQLGIAHIPWAGLDLNRFGQINSSEHNACIGRRRAQGNIDLIAGVQTDARCPNGVFQGSLPNHIRSPNTSIELERGIAAHGAGANYAPIHLVHRPIRPADHDHVILRCDKDTAIRSYTATCFSLATVIVAKLLKPPLQFLYRP